MRGNVHLASYVCGIHVVVKYINQGWHLLTKLDRYCGPGGNIKEEEKLIPD